MSFLGAIRDTDTHTHTYMVVLFVSFFAWSLFFTEGFFFPACAIGFTAKLKIFENGDIYAYLEYYWIKCVHVCVLVCLCIYVYVCGGGGEWEHMCAKLIHPFFSHHKAKNIPNNFIRDKSSKRLHIWVEADQQKWKRVLLGMIKRACRTWEERQSIVRVWNRGHKCSLW